MYYHIILLHNNYYRIGYYKTIKDINIKEVRKFKKDVIEIKKEFENLNFSIHEIMTTSDKISSVAKYDKYFECVEFYYEKEEFKNKLEKR